ncbi:uncharacterized protein EV420DRAFT_394466 [Desarmillaria tabescens]|uniref:C3H1-type domain-containing protein n=1 Tax=Armillaria tabescens TaxID=1929756 RepID=A0AA39KEE1_ARMTA|nr:uncharacterized protein EV420DRAFT_394466 [Desarmillaria tabescens]KAK0458366.1 hypothetical protein EV420DRAFT_394466 [Desarmillaria tabescens]
MFYDAGYCHTGNGVACWYYNHDTCSRGTNCEYSHAADIRSVRDSRGKNVCLHYLQGYCMFGDHPCRYSHDRRFLSSNLSHGPVSLPPPAIHIDLPPAPILAKPDKPRKSAGLRKLDKVGGYPCRQYVVKCFTECTPSRIAPARPVNDADSMLNRPMACWWTVIAFF